MWKAVVLLIFSAYAFAKIQDRKVDLQDVVSRAQLELLETNRVQEANALTYRHKRKKVTKL